MKCDICGKKRVLVNLTAQSGDGILWGRSACRACAMLVRDAVIKIENRLNPKPD